MKSRKQKFVEWMLSHEGPISADDVRDVSNHENLGIQVKTISSNGDFVIKFSERDTFINPSEWLHNYRMSVKERYKEIRDVYRSCFPQETNSGKSSDGVKTAEPQFAKKESERSFLSKTKGKLGSTGVSGSQPRNQSPSEQLASVERRTASNQMPLYHAKAEEMKKLNQVLIPLGYRGEGMSLASCLKYNIPFTHD